MKLGFFLCVAGMLVLCVMDTCAKALGPHLDTFQIAFVRYGGAAIWLAVYIAVTRGGWPNLANWRRHLLRGLLQVVTALAFFYAVTHLPLAIVAALAMSAPIYVSLLGIILLKERPAPILGLAIALGIAGSAIVVLGGAGPTAGGDDISGWVAGIFAPISYAGTIVLLKHHTSDNESAAALSLGTAVVAAITLGPIALAGFVAPDFVLAEPAVPLIWLIGLLGAGGFVLLTAGLRSTPASTFAIVDYMSLLWAAALGFLFFAEVPQLTFWIGGALIIAACAIGMRADAARPGTPAAA